MVPPQGTKLNPEAPARFLHALARALMKHSDPPICRECERLWQNYQLAPDEQLRLLGELHHSISPLTPQEAERLINQVNAAESSRKSARAALDAHRFDTDHE